jgi:hypothetical protein
MWNFLHRNYAKSNASQTIIPLNFLDSYSTEALAKRSCMGTLVVTFVASVDSRGLVQIATCHCNDRSKRTIK